MIKPTEYSPSESMTYGTTKFNLPLILAAIGGCKEIVELLISRGAGVNAVDDEGKTSLHWACVKGHRDVVEFLIAQGAQIEIKSKKFGYTPLHMAAISSQIDIAQLLLEHGAVIYLDIAVMLGDIENVKSLAQGVDVNSQSADGSTLLSKAVHHGHQKIV